MRRPRGERSLRRYMFEAEDVTLDNQLYRTIYINTLLLICIFGGARFTNPNDNEIIMKKKKVTIVHIASNRRGCEIFCLEGLSVVKHLRYTFNYTCYGKVSATFGRRSIIGCTMDETVNDWILTFIDNETIRVNMPYYHNGIYDLSSCIEDCSSRIKVTQY